jgi:HK97 gp10 family phage protein
VPSVLEIKGGVELLRKLEQFPRTVQRKLLRQAIRDGARPILAAAKANCPVGTGELKKSLRLRVRKKTKPGTYAVQIQAGKYGEFKGDQFYAAFVELGHRVGSRKLGNARAMVPANPFMRRAADTTKDRAGRIVGESLGRRIEAEASK